MAYAGHSSIGCPVYPSASTLGSALLEQSNYAPSGFHPSLLYCILNFATSSFLNIVKFADLKTSRIPAAVEGFPLRCMIVILIFFLYRCWIPLEQVKQSTMCFVMWYSLWVARQRLHLAAVADLLLQILGDISSRGH